MSQPKSRAENSDTLRDLDYQSPKLVDARISEALEGRTWGWLSEATGIPDSTLGGYRAKGITKSAAAVTIADVLGVSVDWLLTGRGDQSGHAKIEGSSPDNSVLMVPEYDIEVAAGAGRFGFDREQPIGHWPFPSAWIAQFGDPRDLKLVSVVGDSQEPEFGDGDRVLVDTSSTRPRDGMHVVRKDDALLVKRLQVQGATILLKSTNPIYEDIRVELPADQESFQVIGRVVGAIGVVGNPWSR